MEFAAVPEGFRAGFAVLVGRPNAGKSTLTNALVGQKVAITSNRPQTTRHTIRGIVHRPEHQLILIDTPGLHRPRTLLGQRLNDLVAETLAEVDVDGTADLQTETTLTVSQDLELWGRRGARVGVAQSEREAARWRRDASRLQVAAALAVAYAEAEAALTRAVELDPKNPEALSLLGDYLAARDPAKTACGRHVRLDAGCRSPRRGAASGQRFRCCRDRVRRESRRRRRPAPPRAPPR